MRFVGIDPGLTGALACFDISGRLDVRDMPVHTLAKSSGRTKRRVDYVAVADILTSWREHGGDIFVCIEEQGARPHQGSVSMLSLGTSFGIVLGVVGALKLPHTTVTPHAWKRAMQVGKGKDAARQLASQLFPSDASRWSSRAHHGRAEAVLLADYGCTIRTGFAARPAGAEPSETSSSCVKNHTHMGVT